MPPDRFIGRLTREDEFRRVYLEGFRRSTPLLVIHARANGLGAVRLGFAVGRRFGGAVVRNRLRRRLREAVRAHHGLIGAGLDLVVAPRAGAAGATYASLHAAVGIALAAAGLLDHAP